MIQFDLYVDRAKDTSWFFFLTVLSVSQSDFAKEIALSLFFKGLVCLVSVLSSWK